MKDKIIFLIIGILLGAIISTGSIYFYTLTTVSNNQNTQQSPQMLGTPPSGDNSTSPSMPNNNSQSN